MGTPLIIVAGQSNCFGQTVTRTLPADYLSLPYSAWKWCTLNPTDSRQRRIPWSPLRVTKSYTYVGSETWAGPDLVIAKVLGDAGHTPSVLWHASGATSLAVDWNVTPAGLKLYTNLVDEVARAYASTRNPGVPSSSWLVWIQGETDGLTIAYKDAYTANFNAFWTALKAALSVLCPGLRCVAVKLSTNQTAVTYITNMRTRFDEIAAANADVSLYDATPCAMVADNMHFSETGLVTLGTGIANAMIAAGSL